MSRRRDPRKPRGPWCEICKGERQVDGVPFTKTFANGVTKTYPQRVPCECTKPKPVTAPPLPTIDAQTRAAGEREA